MYLFKLSLPSQWYVKGSVIMHCDVIVVEHHVVSLRMTHLITPKTTEYWFILMKWWLHPDMTVKLLKGMSNFNANKDYGTLN